MAGSRADTVLPVPGFSPRLDLDLELDDDPNPAQNQTAGPDTATLTLTRADHSWRLPVCQSGWLSGVRCASHIHVWVPARISRALRKQGLIHNSTGGRSQISTATSRTFIPRTPREGGEEGVSDLRRSCAAPSRELYANLLPSPPHANSHMLVATSVTQGGFYAGLSMASNGG